MSEPTPNPHFPSKEEIELLVGEEADRLGEYYETPGGLEEIENLQANLNDVDFWEQKALTAGLSPERATQMTAQQLREYEWKARNRRGQIDLLIRHGLSPDGVAVLSEQDALLIDNAFADSAKLEEIQGASRVGFKKKRDANTPEDILEELRVERLNQFEIETTRQNLQQLVEAFEFSYRRRSDGSSKIQSIKVFSVSDTETPTQETRYAQHFSIQVIFLANPTTDMNIAAADWRSFHAALCAHLETLGLLMTQDIKPNVFNPGLDLTVAIFPTEALPLKHKNNLGRSFMQALRYTPPGSRLI